MGIVGGDLDGHGVREVKSNSEGLWERETDTLKMCVCASLCQNAALGGANHLHASQTPNIKFPNPNNISRLRLEKKIPKSKILGPGRP